MLLLPSAFSLTMHCGVFPGNCFTFNGGQDGAQPFILNGETGPSSGLLFLLDANQLQYSNPFMGVGFLFNVHHQSSVPDTQDGVLIQPGQQVSIVRCFARRSHAS